MTKCPRETNLTTERFTVGHSFRGLSHCLVWLLRVVWGRSSSCTLHGSQGANKEKARVSVLPMKYFLETGFNT